MLISKTLSFYKRKDVQKKMIEQAKDKEIAVQYKDFFGKRPDVLIYENDILQFAKKKATSFHCSEEIWINPLSLGDLKKTEMDELRKGWDLILDIDCKHFVYSKLATHLLIRILKDQGVKSITCKFSGNKGFHIAVPFEAFPIKINNVLVKTLFPEAPRKIARYLKDKLKPLLEKAILKAEKGDINRVEKRTGIPYEELIVKDVNNKVEDRGISLDTEKFLEIDTILIASRHLYRMPYSFHEKSGLVSVPVDINKVLTFKKEMAEPDNAELKNPFLDREKAENTECKALLINAYDFYPEQKKKEGVKEYSLPEEAIPEEYFPPTILNILKGLEDGKKRAVFTLINFFKGVGWTPDMIEQKIYEWNERNPEPLREVYLKGQLKQLRKQKDAIPPHNYPTTGDNYYNDLRVWQPDDLEKKVKNPVQYAKLKFEKETKKRKGRPRLTPEQKEMRRKYREKKKNEKNK